MTLSCGGNNSTTAQSVTAFFFLAAGAPRLKDGLLEEPEAKLAQKNRIKQQNSQILQKLHNTSG